MKYKVTDLDGILLDAAVAKAEGLKFDLFQGARVCYVDGDDYQPSSDWLLGGTIIQRERISVIACRVHDQDGFFASKERYDWCIDEDMSIMGPTPLIAAMRAHTASVFGEEVDLP